MAKMASLHAEGYTDKDLQDRLKKKWINYRKHGPHKYEPNKFFGFVIDVHPKYKGINIYLGRYVYSFWRGYKK
jgi:hypothetical protein